MIFFMMMPCAARRPDFNVSKPSRYPARASLD
jgi:hypothetical protein